MEDSNKPWQPSQKQEAPKAKKEVKKTAKKEKKATGDSNTNKDGLVIGSTPTFDQIMLGMKKQNNPVIVTSNDKRKR